MRKVFIPFPLHLLGLLLPSNVHTLSEARKTLPNHSLCEIELKCEILELGDILVRLCELERATLLLSSSWQSLSGKRFCYSWRFPPRRLERPEGHSLGSGTFLVGDYPALQSIAVSTLSALVVEEGDTVS